MMTPYWSLKRLCGYAVLALPGTFLPREAGMSLQNQYWSLGWPIPLEVTVYGPSSGYSGISLPFLPALVASFALWFGVALVSHRVWQRAHAGRVTFLRALSAALVCALWGFLFSFFILGAGRFLLDYHWNSLDEQHFTSSMSSIARFCPATCIGVLAVPFVIQYLISSRYPRWPRVGFVSVAVLLFAGLSTPLAGRIQDVFHGHLLPIERPLIFYQAEYEQMLDMLYFTSPRGFIKTASEGAKP